MVNKISNASHLVCRARSLHWLHLITNAIFFLLFRYGDLSCVRVLLEAYPDSIHCTDFRLQNCLHFAACHGHVTVVKYLLDQGAAVDSRLYFLNHSTILFWDTVNFPNLKHARHSFEKAGVRDGQN